MKRILLLNVAAVLIAGLASSAFAQAGAAGSSDSVFIFTPSTQTVSSNSTFQVTLSLQVGATPSPVDGYDLWLATNSANSGLFSITNVTYSAPYSSFGNITTAQPINDATDISSGYVRNSNDLGNISTSAALDATTGQTVQLATLTISTGVLSPNSSYTFYTTLGANNPLTGTATSNSHYADALDQGALAYTTAQSTFTVTTTAVPEPATCSLLGLGALGSLGITMLRRKRA